MRALIAVVAAALLLVPSSGSATHKRVMTRTIVAPTAITGFDEELKCVPEPRSPGCQKLPVARHVRCLYLINQSANQDKSTGRFGYVFKLTSADGDGTHRFALKDVSKQAVPFDFDIVFYQSLGTCQNMPAPLPASPPSFARVGNEAGKIPKGMRYAIVTLFGGANGKFSLTISR